MLHLYQLFLELLAGLGLLGPSFEPVRAAAAGDSTGETTPQIDPDG